MAFTTLSAIWCITAVSRNKINKKNCKSSCFKVLRFRVPCYFYLFLFIFIYFLLLVTIY